MDYVVLLHGLGRSKAIMAKVELALKVDGYATYNASYPSTEYTIEVLVEHIYRKIQQHCPDQSQMIHFIGHSLGAIIIRALLARHRPNNLGRVVMLAPPNQGSVLVDFLKRFNFYYLKYGPAGQQLGTDKQSAVHRLPPVDYNAGIIAGDRSIDLFFSWFILSGKNDGKLMVGETEAEGVHQHITMHATHPMIPKNKKVIEQALYFLQHGVFRSKGE